MKQRDAAISGIPAMPEAVLSRLRTYAALLARWNPTIRLVSPQDLEDFWRRHIEDALQLVPLIPAPITHAVDLGSGGGLPGIVLAIATGIHFDLIESDGRKAAFLREAAIATTAPVTVHAHRIEDIVLSRRALVTARALAPLPKLLDWAEPFLRSDGVCLFPKGERVEAEIAEAEAVWSLSIDRIPSMTAEGARLLRIRDINRKVPRP